MRDRQRVPSVAARPPARRPSAPPGDMPAGPGIHPGATIDRASPFPVQDYLERHRNPDDRATRRAVDGGQAHGPERVGAAPASGPAMDQFFVPTARPPASPTIGDQLFRRGHHGGGGGPRTHPAPRTAHAGTRRGEKPSGGFWPPLTASSESDPITTPTSPAPVTRQRATQPSVLTATAAPTGELGPA